MSNLTSIIILVVISAIVGAVGALFLKLGSKHFHIKLTPQGIVAMIKNWRIVLGVVLYGLASVFFIISLRLGDLSIVYPMTSMSYIFITILSAIVLKEQINRYKIIGILCIIAGVVLVTV